MGAIRRCDEADFEQVWAVTNDGAERYRGVIPADRWSEPYMTREALRHEIAEGVVFSGYEAEGALAGVMGLQRVRDVVLLRHAYVRTAAQGRGVGTALLTDAEKQAQGPVLIGTWAAAAWAIGFYQKHGFTLVSPAAKERLLRAYWHVPERQIETSVVLANEQWLASGSGPA